MKHPNKTIENNNKQRAKDNMKSCFYYWVDKGNRVKKVDLTEDELLNAIANIRQGGKTVSVELHQL